MVQACGPRTWHQVQRRRVVVHVGGPSEPSVSAPSGSGLRAENLRVQHLRVQAFGPRTFGFGSAPSSAGLRAENLRGSALRAQAGGPRTFGFRGRRPAGRENIQAPSGASGYSHSTSRRRPAGREPGAGLRAENHRLSGTTSGCDTPTDNMRVFVVGLMLQSHFAIELNVDINNLILLLIYNCQTR